MAKENVVFVHDGVLFSQKKKKNEVECWLLTPVILDTQEAEIRRIKDQSQPRQVVQKTLS
jgi:hypothetical protein